MSLARFCGASACVAWSCLSLKVVDEKDSVQELQRWDDLCAGTPVSALVAENCQKGNPPEEWDINAAGDASIQGFATEISVLPGDKVKFKVKTVSEDYRIDIYRAGYYRGLGARLVKTMRRSRPRQVQPECHIEEETLLIDCGNWERSAGWTIPAEAVSGVYIARFVRLDAPRNWRVDASQVPPSPKFSDMSWNHSNPPPCGWGYDCDAMPHAYGAQRLREGSQGLMTNALKEPHASHAYFVVRAKAEDATGSDIIYQTSDPTWHAYNTFGTPNTYGLHGPSYHGFKEWPGRRAYKRSYNVPMQTRDLRSINMLFGAEYPLIRWLERNGYDVSYQSGVDTDRLGVEALLRHRVFISPGHDEYWSGAQRSNVEAARDRGLSLMFLSGNEVYWRVRFEDAQDGSSMRTMAIYKEGAQKLDPREDEWTGTFRNPRQHNPFGANPENSLTGVLFTVNSWRNDAIEVPYLYSDQRIWRGTDVASLQPGQKAVLMKGSIGHEFDEDWDNGFRPKGLIRMSETTINNCQYLIDHGNTFDSGTATHHLVMYRANNGSGGLVFGAGTIQWSWGLDNFHDTPTGSKNEVENEYNTRIGWEQAGPEPAMQQATVNILADMGAQPRALQAGLRRQERSSDRTAPTSEIAAKERRKDGTVAVHGSASDEGGVVAGVEVSLDGGAHWHPAERPSRSAWRYVGKPESTTVAVRSRATDDSCNTETPSVPKQEL